MSICALALGFWKNNIKGDQKKRVHQKCDPTSNRNKSRWVGPIYLNIELLRVPIGDSSQIKFQVILINSFQDISKGSFLNSTKIEQKTKSVLEFSDLYIYKDMEVKLKKKSL